MRRVPSGIKLRVNRVNVGASIFIIRRHIPYLPAFTCGLKKIVFRAIMIIVGPIDSFNCYPNCDMVLIDRKDETYVIP